MKTFEPDNYLKRINHQHEVRLTEEGLTSLHHHQLFSIPFENFDVLLRRPIQLDPISLYNKLVNRPRGGYCFELNGLFFQALKYFGFEARVLLARVHVHGRPMGRSHQVSLVTINDRKWLTDVGFGAFNMAAPIPLEIGPVKRCNGQTLRLVAAEPFGTMLQTLSGDRWRNLYSIDMEYVGPGDITYGNYYTATHPDSIFTRNRIASLPTPEGRITLLNKKLKLIKNSDEQVSDLPDDHRYLGALKTFFGIELDASYDMLPALSDDQD